MANKLSVVFENRDFTARLERKDLKFTVNSFGIAAIGGCKEASISVEGGRLGLWECINLLRSPVEIYDEKRGAAVWWGYVHEAQVRMGALEVAVSLDSMVNRCAVAYSYVAPGTQTVGRRRTTSWADDLDSQAEFGTKELLKSAEGLSDAAAAALRDAIVTAQKWPQGGLAQFGNARGRVRYSGHKNSLSATLTCRGWWETLGWKNASWALTSDIEFETNNSEKEFGTTTNKMMVQSFTTGAQAINVHGIGVNVLAVGAPADNLTLELWAWDATARAPVGEALATATQAADEMTASMAWLEPDVDSEINLAANTVYCIVFKRSGAADDTNYFKLGSDTGRSYTGGEARLSNDSGDTWADLARDLNFRILQDNWIETTTQIQDLVRIYGQFLTATDIEAASGVLLSSYQDGDSTALAVIQGLLAAGGANGRRLLAWVDINRRVQIYEEPAPETAARWMDDGAVVYESGGRRVNELQPPVGQWVRLKDVIPGVVDLTKIVDPSLQFIEESSWSASGGAKYAFKGRPSIESILKVG